MSNAGEDAALRLFLEAEFDAREGRVPEGALTRRLEAMAPLADVALRLLDCEASPRGARFADVGTGAGTYALLLAQARPHWDVLGIDLSPQAVTRATEAAAARGLANVRFEVGDALALPIPDGALAGALVVSTLQLVPDRRAALAELARTLRPGACAVIIDGFLPSGLTEAEVKAGPLKLEKREDVTPLVQRVLAMGLWPWSAAVREDARFLALALQKRYR